MKTVNHHNNNPPIFSALLSQHTCVRGTWKANGREALKPFAYVTACSYYPKKWATAENGPSPRSSPHLSSSFGRGRDKSLRNILITIFKNLIIKTSQMYVIKI